MTSTIKEHLIAAAEKAAWKPPIVPARPDGFECLIWHRGRWRHVRWSTTFDGWAFGYGSPFTHDTPHRLYAPLPEGTPESSFYDRPTS